MSLAGTVRDAVARARQGNLGTVVVNRVRERRNQPRRLLPHAAPTNGRASSRRVNRLVAELGASRYLEVGVHKGLTLETVTARERTAVEPAPMFDTGHLPAGVQVYCGTSDDFFASIGPEVTFDLVFVDGLHVYEQAYRDVINAFRHLAPAGLVLVDDVVPDDEVSAMRDRHESARRRAELGLAGQGWNGDVFVVLAVLRDHHPELSFRVIVGPGNEQAVVWLTDPAHRPCPVSEEVVGVVPWFALRRCVRDRGAGVVPTRRRRHDRSRGRRRRHRAGALMAGTVRARLVARWARAIRPRRWWMMIRCLAPLGAGATVVIVNWDSLSYLRTTVAAVRRFSASGTRIIVVDNGSHDGSLAWLRTEKVETVALGANFGHGCRARPGLVESTHAHRRRARRRRVPDQRHLATSTHNGSRLWRDRRRCPWRRHSRPAWRRRCRKDGMAGTSFIRAV